MAEHSINKEELKHLMLELFEEDQTFFQKIKSAILLRTETINFFHHLNLEVLKNYFQSEKREILEPLVDKEQYVKLVEEKFHFLDKISQESPNLSHLPKPKPEMIERWKKKYAIKKEAIEDLQELFKNEPPASELVKLLSK